MTVISEEFSGEITVASTIVDYLSSGLYENPAACLKELVNNSYDADAELVRVFVKPDADAIVIEDDGDGFTAAEFRAHFSRIARSTKRDDSDVTAKGRKKIGKIGIGFIAANEICDLLEVHSTRRGSTELMKVVIDFAVMREPAEARRASGSEDVKKADYRGTIDEVGEAEHFTRLFLTRVRGRAAEVLAGAKPKSGGSAAGSLYGLNPASVKEVLAGPGLSSWSELDAYSETRLQIAANVPIDYHDGFVRSKRHLAKLAPFVERTKALGFRVEYDGAEVRKPVVFSGAPSDSIVSVFDREGEHIQVSGYFFAEHGTLRPTELNGVLIRIREAAVGSWDPTFLGFPRQINTLFQRWTSGEVWVSDELEEAMNIDRRTLRETHPAYVELQRIVHSEVRDITDRARRELYGAHAEERRRDKASQQSDLLREAISDAAVGLPKAAGSRVERTLDEALAHARSNELVKRFTVGALFELIVDVAEEVLDPLDRERFLSALMARVFKR